MIDHGPGRPARIAASMRRIRVAEAHGVRGGVAVDASLDGFGNHDSAARL